MKTSATIGIVAALIIASGVWFLLSKNIDVPQPAAVSYKNATYIIAGKSVTLVNGHAEESAAPGSASKIVTDYFGNEVTLDLDENGREDIVFLLTQQTGGSGTFYYVVAALNTPSGYKGSHAVLLGDRIAPQTTELSRNPSHKNVIVVNYADRAPGESFAVQPSVGKSIWLKFNPATMQFGEVVQGFEGESDPARMTLDMQTWTWISTLYNDGKSVIPKKAKSFTLTFKKEGTFSATTDCNSMSGTYAIKGNKISFGQMASTMMYCDGSQESEFAKMLQESQIYHFTSKGELVFDFKFDSGVFIFR